MNYDEFVHRVFVLLVRAAIDAADPPKAARYAEALAVYEANPCRRTVVPFQRITGWAATDLEHTIGFVAVAVANEPSWFDDLTGPWAGVIIDEAGDLLGEEDRIVVRLVADGMNVTDALTAAPLILS